MDHRAFLTSLDPEQRTALTTKSNAAGFKHLAGYLALLTGTTTWIAVSAPLWQLMLLPQGILLVFLFTLQHEASHATVFDTPRLNTVTVAICGLILFLPPQWFTYFHLAHHRHTHDPDHDPELATAKPDTWPRYLLHVSGLPLWWGLMRTLLSNARGHGTAPYIPHRKHTAVTREAQAMLTIYAAAIVLSVASNSAALVWLWLLPSVLGQPFLRLYLLAEHGRCPHVANMFENTRTTYTSRMIRFLAWNMPYHAEHHAYPTVPFHQLPALHSLCQPHLHQTAEGYSAFHRTNAPEFTSKIAAPAK